MTKNIETEIPYNAVVTFGRVTVVENEDGDKIFIAKSEDRVIAFSLADMDDEHVTYIGKKCKKKKLQEKYLQTVAKMALKPQHSKYFKSTASLDFNNGAGIETLTVEECDRIRKDASYIHALFNVYIMAWVRDMV